MPKPIDKTLRATIKKEYVEGVIIDGLAGFPSMQELADKYQITTQTISRWSKLENWVQLRSDFKETVAQKTIKKKAELVADKVARFDEKCLSLAEGMINEVGLKIQAVQTRRRNGSANVSLTHNEMKELSATALNAQKLGKLALGEASEITKGTINLEGDEHFRRALERLRAMRDARAESHTAVH